MSLISDDLDAVMADLASLEETVAVVSGSTTINAIKEIGNLTGTDESGLVVEIDGESFLMIAGALSLSVNDSITVGGTAARVRSVQPEPPDGDLIRVVYAT